MGSIGIISLTTRRNRRFFISAEHYPVVKVRPTEVGLRRSIRDRPSPAIRWSVACRRAAGHGSGARLRPVRTGQVGLLSSRVVPSSSVVGHPPQGLVETRRLELLTLSLQRRRSA